MTLYLHATALLRQTQELTLLSDLYSTAYDLTYDAAPLELTSFREQLTRRQTVREVLEIGVVADSILALSVTCGAVSVSREGAGAVLRTGASVRALYLDEGGVPLVAERSIDVSCQLELPEDCRVAARAVCPEEVQGSLTDRGIEVRFPVDFQAEAAQRVKRVCVSAGKINTDAPKETDRRAVPGAALPGEAGDRLGSGEAVQHHHRRDPGSQSAGDGRRYLPGPAAADPPEAGLSHP